MSAVDGRRRRETTLDVGRFYCPGCRADTSYEHVRARIWLTLLSVPVMPLAWEKDYVECQICGRRLDVAALAAPLQAERAKQLALAVRSMFARTIAVAFPHQLPMVARAADAVEELTTSEWCVLRMLGDIEELGPRPMCELVGPLVSEMVWSDRERLLMRLMAFAAVGVRTGPEVDQCLEEAAAALAVPEDRVADLRQMVALGAGQSPHW